MLSHRASWRDWRVLVTLLLVFLAGGLAGASVMRFLIHDRIHGGELSYERLHQELNLTSAQAERIKMILNDFVKFNQDLQTQIEDTRATGKNRIMNILDPAQKKKFEAICKEVQAR